jgi:hypothetical protein
MEQWQSIGSVEGDVYTLAVVGSTVFAGGNFNIIDGKIVSGIGMYTPGPTGLRGKWEALGRGVLGNGSYGVTDAVQAITFTAGCLYVGGSFAVQVDNNGTQAKVVRSCLSAEGTLGPFSPVGAGRNFGTVYALIPAAAPSYETLVRGRSWFNCTSVKSLDGATLPAAAAEAALAKGMISGPNATIL